MLPIEEVRNAVSISEKLFDVYPILLYPCRCVSTSRKMMCHSSPARIRLSLREHAPTTTPPTSTTHIHTQAHTHILMQACIRTDIRAHILTHALTRRVYDNKYGLVNVADK